MPFNGVELLRFIRLQKQDSDIFWQVNIQQFNVHLVDEVRWNLCASVNMNFMKSLFSTKIVCRLKMRQYLFPNCSKMACAFSVMKCIGKLIEPGLNLLKMVIQLKLLFSVKSWWADPRALKQSTCKRHHERWYLWK